MIVVVTGMVGVGKKSYLQKVCRIGQETGREVKLFSVGDMMYAEASDIAPGKILDISLKRLSSLRRSVFKDIIAQSQQVPNIIVNTHATFRWRHGLFPALDFDQMRQLNADMYINIIDGVTALHHRVSKDHALEHTLKDLIVWREEEIISTEMLCKGINEKIPFYCLARGGEQETTETFYKLMFGDKRKKAYLSFPMTGVMDLEETKNRILQFRNEMKQYFICFDPGDLEESFLPHYARHAQEQGRDFVEVEAMGEKFRLKLNEVLQIERDINSQIYARDFMLIDQADMIISFIPTLPDGRAAISSGVERELQHAHEGTKEVYVVWNAEQRPSVFVTQTATEVFSTSQQCLEYFRNQGYIKDQ